MFVFLVIVVSASIAVFVVDSIDWLFITLTIFIEPRLQEISNQFHLPDHNLYILILLMIGVLRYRG
ncbi:hypothetical protein BATR1942_07485 [Bacillus atrophaeus 1942]|uniref:Uncharacterized protein n=1 Tax=Bacillus atrophaeus (strain 1942) TaxID=720555 RepID=A0ABM5LX37_BACA1|nr:hypothetical protein BATR1942_07485 [Bacillus atrophaeus 1942]EIM11759.1 hypothetical protein UY9_05877 [Bacillus atrophaeus C89]